MAPIRAVIYGVGKVGKVAARLMVERGVDIVGAINRPGAKIGRDLGELAGLGKSIGVLVDDDADRVLARSQADVALVGIHDDMASMYPVYQKCIENGLNVISVGAHASFPWRIAPVLTANLDRLARRYQVTVTGSGNQDFFMVNLATLATGVSHRIESITHHSLTNVNGFGPEVANIAHVGETLAEYTRRAGEVREPMSIYTTFWENIASELGLDITDARQYTDPVLGDRAVDCPSLDMKVARGRIVGIVQRLQLDTRQGISMLGEYILKACKPGESEYKKWSLRGEPDLDIRVDRLDTGFTTASQSVNRIPDVINCRPGYVTLEHLPKLRYHAVLERDMAATIEAHQHHAG